MTSSLATVQVTQLPVISGSLIVIMKGTLHLIIIDRSQVIRARLFRGKRAIGELNYYSSIFYILH